MWSLFVNPKLLCLTAGIIAILGTVIYIQHLRHSNADLRNKLNVAEANYSQLKTVREAERNASSISQSNLAIARRELTRLKQLRYTCIKPLPKADPRPSGAAIGANVPRPDGIPAETLYDFAHDCDIVRAKLLGCQALCG